MSCLWNCLTFSFCPPNPGGYRPLAASGLHQAAPVLKTRVELTKATTQCTNGFSPFDIDVNDTKLRARDPNSKTPLMSKILEFLEVRDVVQRVIPVCKAWRFRVEQFCERQCRSNMFPSVKRTMKAFSSGQPVSVSSYIESYVLWNQCKKTAFGPKEWEEYLSSRVINSSQAVLTGDEADAFFSLSRDQRKDARLIFVPMQIQELQTASGTTLSDPSLRDLGTQKSSQTASDEKFSGPSLGDLRTQKDPQTVSSTATSGLSLRKLGILCGLPSNTEKEKFCIQYDPQSFVKTRFPLTDKNGRWDEITYIIREAIWPDRWLGDQTKKPLWIIATSNQTHSLIRQVLLNFTEFVRMGNCFCDKEKPLIKDSTLSKYWTKYTLSIPDKTTPALWVLPDWPKYTGAGIYRFS